jgi:type IV pilus assembly protein PilY1
MPGSDPVLPATAGPYWDFRNIYTYKGAVDGSTVRFIHANITNTDLSVTDNYARFRIINFIYGYTYDSRSTTNPDPKEKRSWILGDIIHSEPKIIDYFDPSDGTLQHRYIVASANDGMLHVFDDATGDEIFAFVPPDLLPRLQEFSNPETHLYMLDSPPFLLRSSLTDANGYYIKTLVFGERRGGKSYWALDVTDPDPLNWKVKWSVTGGPTATGGTAGFEELGYSWSKPLFATIRTDASTVKSAFIFAGGYDINEDGFPEAFDDADEDGARDSDEPHAVTVGGTEGYDMYNPSKSRMGRGIFVVDAATGGILFTATYGDDDNDEDETEDVTTGIDQKYAKMKYCLPADISVIPLSDTSLLMYAADVYGQIWKVKYDYFAEDSAVAYDSATSRRWTVKRIFTPNPGSDMPSGSVSAFTSGPSLNSSDAGRKAFYSPDVSLFGNDWTERPVLYYGTGDREHPRYTMISNRFYVVADADSLAQETDLLNITCDELDDNADADGDGDIDGDDGTVKGALTDLLYDGSALGWYRVLDAQTNCIDNEDADGNPISHLGESVLSQPTLFFKNVYFTSYQPTFDDPCNPMGNAFIYAVDYSFGTSTFNYNVDNDLVSDEIRNISDSYRIITNTSIPSGVKVITRDGHSAGFVSVGGTIVGVGEDGSTTIPGPPGGVTPLLWETD